MIESIIKPKRPTAQGWRRAHEWVCPPQLAALGYPESALQINPLAAGAHQG